MRLNPKGPAGSSGRRRLDNPDDFVRREIAAALRRDIAVIPVLVKGAAMPGPADLPDDLKSLSLRNALEISDTRWDYDVGALIKELEKHVAAREPEAGETNGIFISYRRKDTAGHAGRLQDTLKTRFKGDVFMDIEKIAPGRDFVKAIDEAVGNCSVLLVLIGDQWLSLTDGKSTNGNRPAFARAAGGALLLAALLGGWYLLSGRGAPVSQTGASSAATPTESSAADLKEKEEITRALGLTGSCLAAADDMLEKLTNPDYDPRKFLQDQKRVATVTQELEDATGKYNSANESWKREQPRLELLMSRHPVVGASWQRAQKAVTDYMQCVYDLNEAKSNGDEPADASKVCQREKQNAEEDVKLLTTSLAAARR